MTSAKAVLGAIAGRFFFRSSTVQTVEPLGRFVRIEVKGESLRGAPWRPGDKVQVFLPDVGMRTYTPLQWGADGATSFLGYAHGDGPGSTWAKAIQVGDEVSFFGPRRSIEVSDVEAPLVCFGDETSVALALALSRARPTRKVTAVLEVNDRAEVRAALDAMGSLLDVHLVARESKDAHWPALQEPLRAALSAGAFGLFTGRGASIQAVKRGLSAFSFASKTKAYWADGKSGLD
jgi:NADPH-dependent ferric siderophore reductase